VTARAPWTVLVDTRPPEVDLAMTPVPFSPDDDGEDDAIELSLRVGDASPIERWSVEVEDPYGRPFRVFAGPGAPPPAIEWDGRSATGELVQAAEDYPVTVTVTDAVGNTAIATGVVPVDVLVFREGDRLKIRVSSIEFASDAADYRDFDPEKGERNLKTLERLAEVLKKYPGYRIRIEGHAVSVYWDDPERARREESEELVPLSLARAEAVKQALVGFGIEEWRMTAVGMGGSQPVVPHGDLENRWKSRRVEFILVR